ncbi:MAG: PSD1 and planctomycete cytochrome C domain-containing protein, partial [Chthoniobacteraceae bacterium]
VRPIFERSCVGCHGPEKQKSGCRLDLRRDAFKGGDSGESAIVPHQAEASPLLQYVSGEDAELLMPPKKSEAPPLNAEEIATLTRWIDAGAPWPDEHAGETADEQLAHWAWQPLVRPEVPPAQHANPIDAFISKTLAERSIVPAAEADRRTLIRRVVFDLHGLAPSWEEVEAFVADEDPLAYEKLIDRLLASPRYGERWARHWFDAIHFADTHGFEHDRIREHAWRYRDYVIAALNADTPWPRFVREQLAADVLFPEEPRLTAALGFLGAGPFDQSAEGTAPKMFEVVDRDDMIVQTMAAFTSTTTGCARCHDHKFDPIPQEDYYALAAVFAGVTKGDVAYDGDPNVRRTREHWRRIAAAAEKKEAGVLLGDEVQQLVQCWEREHGMPVHWNVIAPSEITSEGGAVIQRQEDGSFLSTGPCPEKETLAITVAPPLHPITAVRLELLTDPSLPHQGPGRQDNGNLHLSEFELHVVDGTEVRKLPFHLASADFDQNGQPVSHAIDGNEKTDWGIHPRVGEAHVATFELAKPFQTPASGNLKFVLKQQYGGRHIIGRFRISVTDAAPERVRPIPAEVQAALAVPSDSRDEAQRLAVAAHVARLQSAEEIAKLPPQTLVYAAGSEVSRHGKAISVSEPKPIHVLRRGDLGSPGDLAAPGALQFVSTLQPRFDLGGARAEGARRAALANWLVDPKNPLTWRSIVNRVWHHHFGRGIVDSPNDLGRMGGVPSHPELLDWLAADFRDSGGSLKRLHRLILTSAAYRRSSAGTVPEDQDNRLLYRFNRQRLDAESYRDIVLQTAGRLDLTMGGPSVMHFKLGPAIQDTPTLDYTRFDWDAAGANRRSIYRLVYRNIADPFMTALDFPDAAQLAPTRPFSASSLQALALWNDNFVLRQCEHLAARVSQISEDSATRIRAAVRLVWLRDGSEEEVRALTAHADAHGLASMCRVLLNSNEFLFVN